MPVRFAWRAENWVKGMARRAAMQPMVRSAVLYASATAGVKVVAFIKARMPVDAASLDAHCRASSLPNYKRPREYVFLQGVPKSPVGKILRRKLVSGEYDKA